MSYRPLEHGLLFHPRRWLRRGGILVLALLFAWPELLAWLLSPVVRQPAHGPPSAGLVAGSITTYLFGFLGGICPRLARLGRRRLAFVLAASGGVALLLWLFSPRLIQLFGFAYLPLRILNAVFFLYWLGEAFWKETPNPEFQRIPDARPRVAPGDLDVLELPLEVIPAGGPGGRGLEVSAPLEGAELQQPPSERT